MGFNRKRTLCCLWLGTAFSCMLAMLPSCSADGQTALSPDPGRSQLEQDLQAQLFSELAALGKDPQRSVASAPQGGSNAVFNLQAQIIDADGAGGNPPTGVELRWTARVIGDYNQNGEVGISDITPLGQFFKQAVVYDDPGLHDGLAYWPAGDPFAAGSAAWRAAAVDGDANGEINAADITPIAVHYGERMDGFNIYLKETGQGEYSILPNLQNPFLPASQALIPAGNGPAIYTVQIPWPASGMAEIAVAGYDAQSESAAPLSNVAIVSAEPGSPPQSCLAELNVDPSSGEAPLAVQFGLGGSSSGSAGQYRYVLETGEPGVYLSFEDSTDFPLDYTYLSAGNYSARLAVVCLADGQVAFSSQLPVNVSAPAEPGLNVSGRIYQYTQNPVVGEDEPPKNPLPDIEVELYILGESSPLATTTSNASGEYLFANLQLAPSVQILNVKISQAQKDALLPLSWLPDQQILVLQAGSDTVLAPDMNLLASTF